MVSIVVNDVLLSSMGCNAVMMHIVTVLAFIRNEAKVGDGGVERHRWSTPW